MDASFTLVLIRALVELRRDKHRLKRNLMGALVLFGKDRHGLNVCRHATAGKAF